MNRHQRPAAAARARCRRTGYLHRIEAARRDGAMPTAPGVHHVVVEHDGWCNIYRGGHCSCVPDISVTSPDAVTVIDAAGIGIRRAKS
jgi:hypothetical protein